MPAHAWLMAPVIVSYLLAAGFYFAEVFFRVEAASRRGRALLIGAAVLQGVALAGHAITSPTAALSNVFESASVFVWLLVVVFLFAEPRARMTAAGVFITPLAFLISISMLAVHSHGAPPQKLPTLGYAHVGVIVLGYTALALAVCFALVYLTDEKLLKTKHMATALRYFPSLEVADRLVVNFTAFGLSMLTAGIITGILWKYTLSNASPWTERRTVLSILAWLLFALYLFVRKVIGWQGSRAKWVIVAGFAVLVITLVGYQVSSSS